MIAVSKNVYFDVIDDIVDNYKNTIHRSIKMRTIDVTSVSYAACNEDSSETKPKLKVGDHFKISKGYTQKWSERAFVVSKIKNTVPWTHVISDLNGEPIIRSFFEKELQKTSQEKSRIEKGDKLYVKCKGYDSCFNSWIGKKDLE